MNVVAKYLCAGLLLVGLTGLARAALPCESPAAPDAPPPARWQKVFARESDFEKGLRLLGLDGSRIHVTDQYAPHFNVSANGLVALEPVWATLVDWSVYDDASRSKHATPVLYFDGDTSGLRRLCRIERRSLTDAALERNAAAPWVTEIHQWRYDAQRRLTGVENWTRSSNSATWQPGTATCYVYHPRGGLLRESTARGRCGSHERVLERHVYGADQRVLRSIAIEKRTDVVDDQERTVEQRIVVVYDANGQALANYTEIKEGVVHRLPNTKLEGINGFWGVAATNARQAAPDHLQEARLAPGSAWKIIATPRTTSGHVAAIPGDLIQVLAQGEIDADGRIPADSVRPAIREAAKDADTLVMFWTAGLNAILLAPTVTPAEWNACLDETRASRSDCR